MTENVESLLLEHLEQMQAELAAARERHALDARKERVARIERRLEITS